MFLALREIKKEKLRSALIAFMIVLISYLIFILTSLTLGLARQNTDAINSWGIANITLNADANLDMRQSLLTQKQVGTLGKQEALLAQAPAVAKHTGHKQLSVTFMGLKKDEFVARQLKLTAGHKPRTSHQIVADESLRRAGYHLSSQLFLNDDKTPYTIVGFTDHATLNIVPLVYGQMQAWGTLRHVAQGPVGTAVVAKDASYHTSKAGAKTYSKQTLINKLPGYQAQLATFVLMIAFLMGISLIIIAVFLYILTMQKLPNYAVLRAQGIPSRMLVSATISQSVLLTIAGIVIGALLTIITAYLIPASVPLSFDWPTLSAVGVGLLLMALVGSLIPIRRVLHVDPVSVIGG